MDLRHLRSFVTIAQELSFRLAAERLSMSQPPLSRQIKALEAEVGVRLLERDRNRRIVLTDAGKTFLADAKRTLAAADATLRHAREANQGTRGQLNLACIGVLSSRVVPTLLEAFRVRHPEVEVHLVELERAEHTAALREGRIHAGICPDLFTPQDQRFRAQELFACPMVAVLPPNHPQADAGYSKRDLDIQTLSGDTVLVPLRGGASCYYERLEHTWATLGFTPAATHPVDGLPNLLGMVAAGYGVALLPEMLVQGWMPARQIRQLGGGLTLFRLTLVWLRSSTSPVLRNFLSAAQELASSTGGLLPGSAIVSATLENHPDTLADRI